MRVECIPSESGDRCSRRGAFTLIELILTLVIVGLAASVAAPRYASALSRYRLDMAAGRVAADLRRAGEHANASSTPVDVTFDLAAGRITAAGLPSLRDHSRDQVTDLTVEPYGVSITSAAFEGRTSVGFDGFGQPRAGGAVVLGRNGQSRTIKLSTDGRIEVGP